ncbi:cysteine dioxygenase [Pseudomonadota bacterium AL_CKDN230030165-1A_HGKHYDSX7]
MTLSATAAQAAPAVRPATTAAVARTPRRASVDAALNDIRLILAAQAVAGEPLNRATLAQVSQRLEDLAAERHLFPAGEFPAPGPDASESSTRYRLNPDDGDEDVALYLNAINPGKTTVPHNHTTWAVIVALSGAELNRVYRRTDDGARPDRAAIEQVREVVVQPGQAIAFLADDIHSIHVFDGAPTLHFHLYGRPLETLSGRIGIRPETGEIINYNASQMTPSVEVRT